MRQFKWLILLLVVLVACQPDTAQQSEIRVELVADGVHSTYAYSQAISVDQFLEELGISRSPLDRVNPPPYTQIADGMTITIVRVTEVENCYDEEVPYSEQEFRRMDMPLGTREIATEGVNGVVRICEWITYEDGVEAGRREKSRNITREPIDQEVYVGVEDTLEPVSIEGTLVYIADGQAYIMQNNSRQRRPLTTHGGLDGRVFDISPDGRYLLYSRQTSDPDDLPFSNELWAIFDLDNGTPVQLQITDVLTASWRPNAPYTFAYSTAAPTEGGFQGWDAWNDLYIMRVNPQDGSMVNVVPVMVRNLSGLYATWGTRFAWSPDGTQLAYAKANGVGLVDLSNGDFSPFLFEFPYFNPAIEDDWVWQPTLGWSRDSEWLTMTVHGPPNGGEAPINSLVFDVAAIHVSREFAVDALIEQAGIWANPAYSPTQYNALNFEDFKIAYLQARDPLNSVGTEYDLVVADRDGSNPRAIFPAASDLGMRPFGYRLRSGGVGFDGEFVWSPSGRQIAVVYREDLRIVDVETGSSQLATADGQVSVPRWIP